MLHPHSCNHSIEHRTLCIFLSKSLISRLQRVAEIELALSIQRLWRGRVARAEVKHVVQNRVALRIQIIWRKHRTRLLQMKSKALTRIQALWRGVRTRLHLEDIEMKMLEALEMELVGRYIKIYRQIGASHRTSTF